MMMVLFLLVWATSPWGAATWGAAAARDEGIKRGSPHGETRAKGKSHKDQYAHVEDFKLRPNMYPVIGHAEEADEARGKLASLEQRFEKKPNILFFIMDDVGWWDVGFNGGGVAVGNDTPEMDRLAQQGLTLTSAYSTTSCTPTRASIHTGQNPLHHGLLRPPMYGEAGGLDGAVTLPAVLRQLGYVTQGVGKWHMGENAASLPQNVGYDNFRGFLGVSDMYTEWRDQHLNPEVALSPERFAMMERLEFSHEDVLCRPEDREKCESLGEIDLTTIQDLDEVWTQTSVDFITSQNNSKSPYFLYHATRGCHFDNYPNENWAGSSRSRTTFGDCMVEMDHHISRLVGAVESTGELDNTLVVLTSDNGPECEVPPHGRTPFRGCKGSMWEGGVRVPTFAYWRGMIAPRKSEGLFDLTDLFNTAISIAGKPGALVADFVSEETYIDGVDQTSMLLAKDGQSCRKSHVYTMNQYYGGMRVDEFKYIWTGSSEDSVFKNGHVGGFSGSIFTDTGGALMVNLYTNPKEDASIGVRHIPMLMRVMHPAAAYMADLLAYPPRLKANFLSNNPPLYYLAPYSEKIVKAQLDDFLGKEPTRDQEL